MPPARSPGMCLGFFFLSKTPQSSTQVKADPLQTATLYKLLPFINSCGRPRPTLVNVFRGPSHPFPISYQYKLHPLQTPALCEIRALWPWPQATSTTKNSHPTSYHTPC